MNLSRLLLAAGLLALIAPAAANADSIVYIDQGNVWSASPDGARKVQLTTGGSWHSPTQADDGTIAAVQGTGPITVMARDGRPLRTITTPEDTKSGDGGTFAPRPVQLSFSPDGSKIAYAYVAYSCPVASTCGSVQRSTFYTAANVTQATPYTVYGNQFSVSNPEWVTNSRTLVFGGYGRQVAIDDLDAGDYNSKPWMVPDHDMGDGEVTRDGTKLAATTSYGENLRITFYVVNGDVKTAFPPADPDLRVRDDQAGPQLRRPVVGPGQRRHRVGVEQGHRGLALHRVRPEPLRGAERPAADRRPAPSPTGAPPTRPPPRTRRTPTQPAPPPVTNPAPTPNPAASLTLTKATSKALKKGLAVKVTVPGRRPRRSSSRRSRAARSRAAPPTPSRPGASRSSSARCAVAQGQDPHPQVDVQRRDDDEVAEGPLAARFRAHRRTGVSGRGEDQCAHGGEVGCPPMSHDARVEALDGLLAEAGLDAVLATKDASIAYFTGFWGLQLERFFGVDPPPRRRGRADRPDPGPRQRQRRAHQSRQGALRRRQDERPAGAVRPPRRREADRRRGGPPQLRPRQGAGGRRVRTRPGDRPDHAPARRQGRARRSRRSGTPASRSWASTRRSGRS